MPIADTTILIVDDMPLGCRTLEEILRDDGYQLVFAFSGPEALGQAAALMPDLLLLDVMMPGMDGFEVCRRLRADPHLAELPIVLITTLDDRGSRLRGIEAGADDFLSKPFDQVELRARVRTITRLNRYRKLRQEHARLAAAHQQLETTHQHLETAYDATIEGWVSALDLRDKETEGHTQRVTDLAVRVAQALGLEAEAITQVRRGALLHDIGKLGIPDAILLKPGPLTDAEWVIMRRHPTDAYTWLSAVAYLRPALDIPHYHHEKWDGSGYPEGLCGAQIPLAARLFALVDVWDALRSDRPYRAAWPAEKVAAYLRGQAGSHFDPELVEVFLQVAHSAAV